MLRSRRCVVATGCNAGSALRAGPWSTSNHWHYYHSGMYCRFVTWVSDLDLPQLFIVTTWTTSQCGGCHWTLRTSYSHSTMIITKIFNPILSFRSSLSDLPLIFFMTTLRLSCPCLSSTSTVLCSALPLLSFRSLHGMGHSSLFSNVSH